MRDGRLEDRCLLASGVPFPTPNASLSQVMYNGVTGAFQKTITITNNNPTQFLYAFLEGENSRQAIAPYQGTGAFDPYDPAHQEYRGYIGYTDGTTDYAGLPPLSSITITVPLAFWDSGRIIFSTDGTDQFSTAGGDNGATPTGAPFYYLNDEYRGDLLRQYRPEQQPVDVHPDLQRLRRRANYMPTDSDWQSPMASGLFQNGQTYNVTGPGLPAGGVSVTIDSSNPTASRCRGTRRPRRPSRTSSRSRPAGPSPRRPDLSRAGFTLTTQGSPARPTGSSCGTTP